MNNESGKISRTPRFSKHYKARIQSPHLKKAVIEAVQQFLDDSSIPELRDHELQYSMKKLRSFSVTEDVRIIYLPTKNGAIFLDIGTHEEVYQK